ncbi:hypothetical protein C8J56DRAFT_1160552 [Mycena floridula]|nr:hypothetical protein C8J56DRAFT_1160552 [Mycena floridula]
MPVLAGHPILAQTSSILNVLPNELTTEIISLCDSRSQAALCRVSKHFQQLAHRRLYQIVSLDDSANVISFDAALSANSEYGSWVRNLHIMGSRSRAGEDRMTRILKSMTKVRRLSMWWANTLDWKELSLPELRILKLSGFPHTDIITAFLNRHPKISHLAVCYPPVPQSRMLRVDLPNLTAFQGAVKVLGHNPKLRAVRLDVIALEDLDILQRFPTCQDIHISVSSHSTAQHAKGVLKRLPLPNLKSCMLAGYFSTYSSSELKSILVGDFPCLKQLESFCVYMREFDRDERDSIVESWLKTCTSLQECALLNSSPNDSAGRYKIVDGGLQASTEPCRSEKIWREFSLFTPTFEVSERISREDMRLERNH